ncbi:MAG TPA: hypothetical protein VK281_16060 [Xanthobacteraceae bacterium]|nr:hypothetical protein [Xanthobacteraceae bacterium]
MSPTTQRTYPRFSSHMLPYCSRCDMPMQIDTVCPDLIDQTVDEITFRCPVCGVAALQIMSRGRGHLP